MGHLDQGAQPRVLADEQSRSGRSAEQVLRGLASGDNRLLRSLLEPAPAGAPCRRGSITSSLPAATESLIRLAALMAVGASTTSLRWAVEAATRAGAQDEEIVDVLATMASTVGSARVVAAAPRLALAIGYDIEIEGCDGY